MDNLLLNSLNKKILLIATILLFVGIITQTYRYNPNNHNKVYMHEVEKSEEGQIPNVYPHGFDEDFSIQFLPLDEIEDVLLKNENEKLYVKTDPNFEKKVENIRMYMGKRNSPLAEEAEYIVMIANKYDIDYRLVPAISIIESGGGVKLYRKYNAWGWGGAKGFTFENWEHSIYVVSRGLRGYYNLGLDTPEKMAPRYNPHTPNEWSGKVRMVMNQIGQEL